MVAVASRTALIGEETHHAWVAVFAAITRPPADPKRAACPNCGRFAIDVRFLADAGSRVGLCAMWCGECGHGHSLSRVRVPDDLDFVSLDGPDEALRDAVPAFYDAAAHESEFIADVDSAVEARIASLRPFVAEYEVLRRTRADSQHALPLLSPRELEVVKELSSGDTVGQIADELGISPTTVRTYLQRASWKLGHAVGGAELPLRHIPD